jgi:hypothetical protein
VPKGSLENLIGQLPALVAWLVAEGSPREIAGWADRLRCEAMRARRGLELRNAAAEAWLELEAGCGEKLAGNLSRGRPRNVQAADSFRLEDIGISRNLSMRMQAIAAIPKRVRDNYYRTARDAGWEITWGGANGLQQRAAADHHELARQRSIRLDARNPEDLYFMPAGTGTGRSRPQPAYSRRVFTASNDPVAEPTVDLRLGDCLVEMSHIPDHTGGPVDVYRINFCHAKGIAGANPERAPGDGCAAGRERHAAGNRWCPALGGISALRTPSRRRA